MDAVTKSIETATLNDLEEQKHEGGVTTQGIRELVADLQSMDGYTPQKAHAAIDDLFAHHKITDGQAACLHDYVGVGASRAAYGANGGKAFNLNDPAQARALIIASPQTDNDANTKNDLSRCGAASALNGLLLAGDPGAAATAISGYANDCDPKWQQKHPEGAAALRALRAGTLTPNQAAQLQELLFVLTTDRADVGVRSMQGGVEKLGAGNADGLTAPGVASLLSGLRAHGGFANVQSVTADCVEHPGGPHWVITIVDKKGASASADSWPGPDGRAKTGAGPAFANVHAEKAWVSSVTMDNGAAGVSYTVSSVAGDAKNAAYLRWSDTVAVGVMPDFTRSVRELDRATGALLEAVP
jgi:hypothetical protein